MMALLRFAAAVALAFWCGGLVALGAVAAPTLFSMLELKYGATGRADAAALFGTVFATFIRWTWVAGGVVVTSLAVRAALGPRPKHMAVRVWAVSAMLAASLVIGFYLAPRIEAARAQSLVPIATLSESDPTRLAFGRWHAWSNALALFTVVSGLGLLWAELSDRH